MKEQYNDTKAGDTISIYSYLASSKRGAGNVPRIQANMGKNIFIFPMFLLMFLPPLAGGMRRVPLVWHRGLMGEKGA